MMKPEHLLQSKLCFLGASQTIVRNRFQPLFDRILCHRLTTIIAGAGYGKSTMAAQAVDYLNVPAVWFRMDEHDQDISTFLTYLVEGLRRQFPKIGADILKSLTEGRMTENWPESSVRMLLSALQHETRKELLIIFDDFHCVQHIPAIRKCLLDLIQCMPSHLHIIIVSRVEPALPLALARARREVLDIREPELNFTAPEIANLYSEIFQFKPDGRVVKIIQRKTAGWVSGVILFYHTLQGRRPDEKIDLIHKINGSHDVIATYLEENVYQNQSQEMKHFLLTSSLFNRLQVDLYQEFNPACDAMAKLRELENKHLFTFSVDATRSEYHYHRLFKDFLVTKLKQVFPPNEIKQLNRKIAVLLEKRGLLEEALDHYIQGHRWKSACRLFRDAGRLMLILGHLKKFKSYLAKIPQRYSRSEPMLQYMEAQTVRLAYGRSIAAKHFQMALKQSINCGDIQVKYLSLKEIALEHAEAGNYKEARQQFKMLLDMPSNDLVFKYRLEINLVVMVNLLNSSAILGLFDEARHYLGLIRQITNTLAEDHTSEPARAGYAVTNGLLESLLEIHAGNPFEGLSLLDQLYARVRQLKNSYLLQIYYFLKAHASFCICDYKTTLKASMDGLKLQNVLFAGSEPFAWFKLFSGRAYLEKGQPAEAQNSMENAIKSFKSTGNYHGQGESYLGLYYVALSRDDVSGATRYLKSSHDALKRCTVPLLQAVVLSQLALFKLDRGDAVSAVELYKKAKQASKNFPVQQAIVRCLQAQYYWRQGRKTFAIKILGENLRVLSEKFENHQEKKWQLIPIIPLLADAYIKGVMNEFLRKLFKKIGPTGYNHLNRLAAGTKAPERQAAVTLISHSTEVKVPDLEVHFFKSFSLEFSGKKLANEHWKNGKALLLFKYMVISRKKGFLPKEVLMEFLWPEENPAKTNNRFHVTLHALRKMLEANFTRLPVSPYLERCGAKYRIANDKIKSIDTEEFEKEIELGLKDKNADKAILHFQKAERIYTGDFLEDEPYAQWCYELRDHLKRQYFKLMDPILDYFELQEAYETCIRYTEKFIARDCFNEEAYQRLMKYHYLLGNSKKVTSIFNRCRQVINEELDAPLSPETLSLYQRLSKK